jgi:hypothetical protein
VLWPLPLNPPSAARIPHARGLSTRGPPIKGKGLSQALSPFFFSLSKLKRKDISIIARPLGAARPWNGHTVFDFFVSPFCARRKQLFPFLLHAFRRARPALQA